LVDYFGLFVFIVFFLLGIFFVLVHGFQLLSIQAILLLVGFGWLGDGYLTIVFNFIAFGYNFGGL
jgi:hypothetical protein